MNHYNVIYDKTANTVAGILLPMAIVPPGLYLVAKYLPPDAPEWLAITAIISLITITISLSISIIFKTIHKGMLILCGDGFAVQFNNPHRFTPPSFEVKTSEIIQYDPIIKRGRFTMKFSTSEPPHTFNISPDTKDADELVQFLILMAEMTKMVDAQKSKVGPGIDLPPV